MLPWPHKFHQRIHHTPSVSRNLCLQLNAAKDHRSVFYSQQLTRNSQEDSCVNVYDSQLLKITCQQSLIIIWLLHNLVEARINLFRYLSLGDNFYLSRRLFIGDWSFMQRAVPYVDDIPYNLLATIFKSLLADRSAILPLLPQISAVTSSTKG